MFNKFCYDVEVKSENDDISITLGQAYAFEYKDKYDKIYNQANIIINDRTIQLKNDDRIFISPAAVNKIIAYKLENYCDEKKILIRNITTDYHDANVLITDPIEALNVFETTLTTLVHLIKIKDILPLLFDSHLDIVIPDMNDYIAVSNSQLELIQSSGLKFESQNEYINIIWVSKKEIYNDIQSIASLIHFIDNNLPIIYIDNFVYDIHSVLVELDENMVDSLITMFNSPDITIVNSALTIVCDCNREKSLPYLAIIWYLVNFRRPEISPSSEFMEFMIKTFGAKPSFKNIAKFISEELPLDEAKHLIHKYNPDTTPVG